MSTALRLRRGTTTQHSAFTGLAGEVTIDTTKNTVVVHDGATAGGIPLAKEATASAAVRYDAAQALTAPQKAQARSNIGAGVPPAGNGLVAQTGADTMAARSIAPGAGIAVSNGDGVAGNPTVSNTGVLSIGGTSGTVTVGTGLAMNAGVLSCTVTGGGVSSFNGNSGAITAAQAAAAATAGYGYTPANPASYVAKDHGAGAIGMTIMGYAQGYAVAPGGTAPGASLCTSNNGVSYGLSGTWRNISNISSDSVSSTAWQRIA